MLLVLFPICRGQWEIAALPDTHHQVRLTECLSSPTRFTL